MDFSKNLIEFVSSEYPELGSFQSSEPCDGYSINSSNFVLHFSKGKTICKIVQNVAPEHIESLLELSRFCADNGAKVPAGIPSKSGGYHYMTDQGILFLLPFMEGSHFNGELAELEDFSKELSKLHAALSEFPSNYLSNFQEEKYIHLDVTELESVSSSAEETCSEFDRYVLENTEFISHRFALIKKQKNEHGNLQYQYIHGDLHPGNVLFHEGRVSAILDLNSVHKGELLRDVAFACSRFALYKCDDSGEMESRIASFIEAYNENSNILKVKKEHIRHFFIDECLCRISYILRDHYLHKKTEWSFDLKKHVDNIRKIESVISDG